MKINIKYGLNEVAIPIGVDIVKVQFTAKYGVNIIDIPIGGETIKIRFVLKYGVTDIAVPVDVHGISIDKRKRLKNIFIKQVTIYNIIPAKDGKPAVYGNRYVIKKCNIQGSFKEKSKDTIRTDLNTKTVYTRDTTHYLPPDKYYSTEDRHGYYTAVAGDFIVFSEVYDTISNAAEFNALKAKYSNIGITVNSATAYINGLKTDNIIMSNE